MLEFLITITVYIVIQSIIRTLLDRYVFWIKPSHLFSRFWWRDVTLLVLGAIMGIICYHFSVPYGA